jgi:hypothetical protein
LFAGHPVCKERSEVVRIASPLAVFLLSVSSSRAGDVQVFNTDVLGQPTSQPIRLLVDKKSGDSEPFVLWTDVACGRYIAASAFYQKPVVVSDVVVTLEKLYGTSMRLFFGPPMWLWRLTDKRFAIQLMEADGEGDIRVTYLFCGRTRPRQM